MWTFVPILPNSKSTCLGEIDKWVSLSEARFQRIVDDGGAARVAGSAGEGISIGFISKSGEYSVTSCVFKADKMIVSSSGTCAH